MVSAACSLQRERQEKKLQAGISAAAISAKGGKLLQRGEE